MKLRNEFLGVGEEMNLHFQESRRTHGKAREGRIASYLTHEQRSQAGWIGASKGEVIFERALSMCCILFLLCWVLLASNPALAADTTVCASGCDYTTIQAAINATTSGNRVLVTDSGTYDEIITMKDGVNVESGTGVTPTIRRNSGSGKNEVVSFSGSITCNLIGFKITSTVGGAGIFMDGSGAGITATIENCDIYSNTGGGGIRLNGVVSSIITGCNIYSNQEAGIATAENRGDQLASGSSITIKGNTIGGSGQGNGEAGIYLDGSGSSIDVTIGGSTTGDANTISYNTKAGIRLENIDQVSIENNNISNNSKAGILLIDASTVSPHIKNNNIHDHSSEAGINIGGASSITIGDSNDIYSNYAGIVFYVSTNSHLTGDASSQPVTITGNDINNNSCAGIAIKDPITNTVTITDNGIHQNDQGGIGIQNSCTLVITENTIRDQVRGGIHTGTDVADGGGFSGSMGSAVLTVRQNKVYNNGMSNYGGGIDVRHASGTIENNLVYENHRGGIRFGWENALDDHITDILNNTVVDNGNASEDKGGGIIYDNLAGAVNDEPAGDLELIGKLNIKNNICVENQKAGLRACFTNTEDSEERDYNLLYGNYRWSSIHQRYNKPDCGWPNGTAMSCANQQFGGCGGKWNSSPPPPVVLRDPNDKMANPLFKHDCLIDDDTTTGNTPGNGTYVLFYVHKGYPYPGDTYQITDVRLYGSATSYTWDVYVGNDPLTGCTGSWGTLVKSNWSVGSGWHETAVTNTSGRYIKLVTSSDIDENTIFEFAYKSAETGQDWQIPVMVVYKCTDIAEDNYELLAGSPAKCSGECQGPPCTECVDTSKTDMGAYGGSYPIGW